MQTSSFVSAPKPLAGSIYPARFISKRLSALRERLDRVDGLSALQLLIVFLVAAFASFTRSPSLFLHPQFYGEDGTIWYAQAYQNGWLHSFTTPYAGYLSSLQRLCVGLALPAPFSQVPLIMALTGLAVQCLPVPVLLSRRCRTWGPLSLRIIWALLYISLPNTKEVHVNLTNSQWHLPLAVILIALAGPAPNLTWKLFDVVAVVLVGLTGPYCFPLLVLLVLYYFRSRYPWTGFLGALTAACSAVQAWCLTHYNNRISTPLGASLKRLVQMMGGNVAGGTLVGGRHHIFFLRLPVALLCGAVGIVFIGYVLLHGSYQLRLVVVFASGLVAGALSSPLIATVPRWEGLVLVDYSRYWFFPKLAFIWCVAWCCWTAKNRMVKNAAAAWLCLATVGILSGWYMAGYPDSGFGKYSRQFEEASPGTVMTIPEAPVPSFTMTIRKH